MKRVYYFIRNYKYDFLAAISAAILARVSFSLNWDQQIAFILSSVIIFIFLFVIIYLRLRDRDFYFVPLTDRKNKDDWIGSGIFEYVRVDNCFQITNTDPGGYVFSKCLTWSDYKYEFEFKIVNKYLGAVVRAINLSNLVMLQITEGGVRPHICINGGYFVWEAKATGLSFTEGLSIDKWYRCQIFCEKSDITIKIFSEKGMIFDRQWKIPGGKIEFSFPKDDKDKNPTKIHFPINLEYGSVGFRNSSDGKALIKNVLVEKI